MHPFGSQTSRRERLSWPLALRPGLTTGLPFRVCGGGRPRLIAQNFLENHSQANGQQAETAPDKTFDAARPKNHPTPGKLPGVRGESTPKSHPF